MNRPIKTIGSASPVFDGNEALCWVVNMTNNVGDARVKHIMPGVLYTFVFRQDAAGGNTFQWPGNCIDAPPICLKPNSITTVNFIGTQNAGNLICNAAPATWTME